MDRRQFSGSLAATLGAFGLGAYAQNSWGLTDNSAMIKQLREIEAGSGGRLGVALFDSRSGQAYAYRGDERFPLCSTFKLLAAALVLKRVDQGRERLARRIRFTATDLVEYSPVTGGRVGGSGMSLAELCAAAITQSDNTAANLLLNSFGGPLQLTAFLRSLGDGVTRLDRIEPELNEALAGDPRDTTTPDAMLATMRRLLLGTALTDGSRRQLTDWLLANQTGGKRLRARLPAGWRVADKTGSGANGTSNDVGMLLPPDRAPLLVAAYLTGSGAPAAVRDDALAQVGQWAASVTVSGTLS